MYKVLLNLLFTHELADPGLPLAALVLGDSPEPGAPPDEAGALSPEDLDELLLAEAVHLVMPWQEQCCLNQTVRKKYISTEQLSAHSCS
jgi:hypothetical protein